MDSSAGRRSVQVTANRASATPAAAELVSTVNEAAELDDATADRVVLAWLRGAEKSLGFPDDVCGQCLTALQELVEADGTMDLKDLVTTALGPDPEFEEDFDEDLDMAVHVVLMVGQLVEFGAVTAGPGPSEGAPSRLPR